MKTPLQDGALSASSLGGSMTSRLRSDALPPPPNEALSQALGHQVEAEWLAGDGSDRCYYRLRQPGTDKVYVLMQLSDIDAKALRENGYDWIHIGRLLADHRVPVPRLIAPLPDYAALVIEDYGDVMFERCILDALGAGERDKALGLYRGVFDILVHFLEIPANPKAVWCQRAFDEERLIWEMNFFVKNYLEPVLGMPLSASDQKRFGEDVSTFSRYLAQSARWFVHRDFHSRNIMWKAGQLAVIDFQDARLGPSSYDLVSLCFDSYVPLPQQDRINLINEAVGVFKNRLGERAAREVEDQWRVVLLQRQLKAIGSFGYLSIKKNRGNYLRYVRPALDTLLNTVGDDRWPFVSRELLQRMDEGLNKQ